MAKYRVKVGQHVGADKSKPVKGLDGKDTGRFERRTYTAGQTVDSDLDLVARFGEDKFEYVSGSRKPEGDPHAGLRTPGDPVPQIAADNPAVAPGGQVSTGFQQTSGGKPGPMSAEDAAAHGERSAQEADKSAKETEDDEPVHRTTVHHGRGHPKK